MPRKHLIRDESNKLWIIFTLIFRFYFLNFFNWVLNAQNLHNAYRFIDAQWWCRQFTWWSLFIWWWGSTHKYITISDACRHESIMSSRWDFLEHPCKVLRYSGTDPRLAYSRRCRTSHTLDRPVGIWGNKSEMWLEYKFDLIYLIEDGSVGTQKIELMTRMKAPMPDLTLRFHISVISWRRRRRRIFHRNLKQYFFQQIIFQINWLSKIVRQWRYWKL